MEKQRKIYQLVDSDLKYRSVLFVQGEPVEFISRNRKEAIIYTKKEAFALAKHYKKNGVKVMVEIRTALTKKDI